MRRPVPALHPLVCAVLIGLLLPSSLRAALTPTQQRILAEPAVPAPDARFSFDDPTGPQFSEVQKQSQREAGGRVLPAVQEAFRSGAASVRIPAGDYRFGHERWDREGVVYALEFAGLQRDAEHPFLIDATGATFWFDLPNDQAPTAHFCAGFKDCRNIIFRGATLERGTRGHVEGRITAFDFPGNRIEIQLSPGVPLPSAFSDKTEQRLVPFKADGTFCAPLYALQAGGVRLKYRHLTAGTQPGRCWVALREPALLDTIRDPAWLRAYGEQGVLRVGDGLSCIYAVSAGLELVRCANLTIDGVSVHVPKGWGAEWGGEGGHLWKNCYFGPRPGTSQWQGGEGFMFCGTRHGTTLDNVTIRHTTDDTANFHGYWGNIASINSNRVTFALNHEFRSTVLRGAVPGDRLLFHDKTTCLPLGSATVTAVESNTMILDQPAACFTNAIVEWPDHACAGWTIQNCHWQDNYQRLLIQSGPGTVRNCTFTRQGSALEMNSVMPYVEGGVPRDITITGNVFTDVNPLPHGAAITVYSHGFARDSAPTLSNIVITGNTFVRPGEAAIALSRVTHGEISSNRFERVVEQTALARPAQPRHPQAIRLSRCADFRVQGNTLLDPSASTASDAVTGSKVLGLDEHSRDITLDGRLLKPAPPAFVLEGRSGPGAGQHIVFVSGDEEYRSEESLPMLARLLAARHGFKCTVLFAINRQTGEIDPNTLDNIPGLEALATADLMVICTRFRELPDEQMQFVDAYLDSGRPVIGIRPAVVSFRNKPASRFFKYSSDNRAGDFAGGFGQQVLGSTWIAHHGAHGQEGSRGVLVEAQRAHPILRGVDAMWGPTDVYTIRTPIPHDGQVLVMGQVLTGMKPDDGPSPKPLMPLAWTKTYPAPRGSARVFMTTMGASQDFLSEGFRRMVVNACFWAVGLEDKIPARNNVDFAGPYAPTPFGFNKFTKGLQPADLAAQAQ